MFPRLFYSQLQSPTPWKKVRHCQVLVSQAVYDANRYIVFSFLMWVLWLFFFFLIPLVIYLLVFHVCFVMFSWTYWKSIFTPPATPCKKVFWVIKDGHIELTVINLHMKGLILIYFCCSSFICHTQTSKGTSSKRDQMLRNRSWLTLLRNCPFSQELSLGVSC